MSQENHDSTLGKKDCPSCKETKFLCEFHVDRARGDGRTPNCKKCRGAAGRKRYPLIKEDQIAYVREWQKKNPERMRTYAIKARGYYREYHAKRRTKPEGRYQSYRDSAIRRGYEFSISLEQFAAFENKPCWYCGNTVRGFGIDRVDNKVGYLIENIVSCCRHCNWAKRASSKEQFLSMCLSVAVNHAARVSA